MQSNTQSKRAEKLVLNKGIEVMLPRGRRVPTPSWFDRTFRLLNRSVRVRIDIRKDDNGN
jgi:hypothetical protein